ncbi:uncharacterized protein EDB91DRAFT_1254566 [Suillus paluster]|uniref:uncharacterized protein n=1 Tax=Suillus paluster TaxID=48578 RepID=UPI001B86CBEF|nr:uncharacterized protein EDB91DRAFT_1254566 [Suillus paluster]KAG1725882.1 hypothetical protein EDB91DRAFT_1254566 [Suillus paluster]
MTRDLVSIDLAKGILGTVANNLIITQSVIKNQSNLQATVDQCNNITQILERATKDATDDDLSVNRIYSEVASKKEQGFWQRLLSVTSDHDWITRWEKDLDRVIPLFNAEMLECPKVSPSCAPTASFRALWLCSASALVILDNAETFEEADAPSALREIPPAISEIADIPSVILILTSRSGRNAPNIQWITKDIPPLDLNSALKAFFRIYRPASRSNAEGEISNLLEELGFHPISINLLANAAQKNGSSPAMLLERWKGRHSAVLDHGEGKLQNLTYTMQLSLNSPSDPGPETRRGCSSRFGCHRFLAQGLDESLASNLLLSLPQVDAICNVLCMQSLIYRQHNFIKMLAPIQHFVLDVSARKEVLQVLAEIAFFDGRFPEAIDILQEIIAMEGQPSSMVLWCTVWKVVVASNQGTYDLAREFILQSFGPHDAFALRSARTFLHASYVSVIVELTASEYDRAEFHFTATIEGCDIQDELLFKAFSVRRLGEVAFAHDEFLSAA